MQSYAIVFALLGLVIALKATAIVGIVLLLIVILSVL